MRFESGEAATFAGRGVSGELVRLQVKDGEGWKDVANVSFVYLKGRTFQVSRAKDQAWDPRLAPYALTLPNPVPKKGSETDTVRLDPKAFRLVELKPETGKIHTVLWPNDFDVPDLNAPKTKVGETVAREIADGVKRAPVFTFVDEKGGPK